MYTRFGDFEFLNLAVLARRLATTGDRFRPIIPKTKFPGNPEIGPFSTSRPNIFYQGRGTKMFVPEKM